MRGDAYCRPLLCRLCECPAVDGGVRLQTPQREKLSRWWKAHWDTDLEQKSFVVCYFCVWDLRFLYQHSEEKEPADQKWWPQNESSSNSHLNIDKYYYDGWMTPCSVKIAPLANEDKLIQEYEQQGLGHRYRCPYCPKNFANQPNLVGHARKKHPKEFIFCTKRRCGKFFHTEEEKAEHTKKEHQATKDGPQKCIYCGKVCTNHKNLNDHLLIRHKKQTIRCKYNPCKKFFKTKEVRDNHFKSAHSSGKFFCCFCERYFEHYKSQWEHMKKYHKKALKCNGAYGCPNYFKTEEDRQKHIQERHSKKYKCLFCSAPFNSKKCLNDHIKSLHSDVALKCEYNFRCPTWFRTEEERQKHYKEDHENHNDKIPCPLCNKKILGKGVIRSHFRTHHTKEKVLKCDYTKKCPNYFKSEEEKLKHIQEVHEIHDERFRCLYCQKIIPKSMYHHINRWHQDVAIKCNFHDNCPNYFKTVEDRGKHVREVHQTEKIREAASCLYCDKILCGMDSLRLHIKIKHSEIAISCQYPRCGTFFKSKEDLERHFSLKPKHKQFEIKEPRFIRYECDFCQVSFYYKYGLKRHIMSKHTRTTQSCPHCKKPTAVKSTHITSDFGKECNQKIRCLGLLNKHVKLCRPLFHCPVCSESFKTQCQLNYHGRRHHKVPILEWKGLQWESRGFKCDECLTYFNSKDCLVRHNRDLHRSIIFTCDFCQKQFSSKELVKHHMVRYHLGLIKYVHCPVCNLKMEKHNKLWQRAHAATHFNQDFVNCQICGKIMKPGVLKAHMKMLH